MTIFDLLTFGRHFRKGQTMTEYVLLLSALAVVVFAGYQFLGNNLQTLINSVDGQL
jgi:Flp pilus assembly pilin Flp